MRNLGLDIGERRIGIAISDAEEILASPLITLARENDEKAVDEIAKLAIQHEIKRIVVGMPYSLNGTMGIQANKVMTFIDKLRMCTDIEIKVQDERLSTVAAERLMVEAGMKSDRRKLQRDAAAATLILQAYLDSQGLFEE